MLLRTVGTMQFVPRHNVQQILLHCMQFAEVVSAEVVCAVCGGCSCKWNSFVF